MVLLNVVSLLQNIYYAHGYRRLIKSQLGNCFAAKLFHVGDKTKAQLSTPKGKKAETAKCWHKVLCMIHEH